jgi:hypothetical protein
LAALVHDQAVGVSSSWRRATKQRYLFAGINDFFAPTIAATYYFFIAHIGSGNCIQWIRFDTIGIHFFGDFGFKLIARLGRKSRCTQHGHGYQNKNLFHSELLESWLGILELLCRFAFLAQSLDVNYQSLASMARAVKKNGSNCTGPRYLGAQNPSNAGAMHVFRADF